MRWFPLWGSIYRNKYGYGKIPASSSGVESEFKNIKTKFFKGTILPMRVDDFVEFFVLKYLKGRTNLYIAKDLKLSTYESDKSVEEKIVCHSKNDISNKSDNYSVNVKIRKFFKLS